jgi:hypothetical protein
MRKRDEMRVVSPWSEEKEAAIYIHTYVVSGWLRKSVPIIWSER